MLEFAQVNQYYAQSHILRDVTLQVPKGQCTCLMGRNGVGKTTLLKCLMGLLPIKSGTITFKGKDIAKLTPEDRARLGLGYVPQGRQIFPLLTIEENLRVGMGIGKNDRRHIPTFVFDYFPVLKEMLGRRGGDLSGGQQQQLAIARALLTSPELLVLDEPTEGIQPNITAEIAATVRKLNASLGLTVLLVEQKLPFARRMADSFAIMERGAIAATGKMALLDDATVKRYLSV